MKGMVMLKRVSSVSRILLTLVAIFISASITTTASNTGFTTLDVNGEAVKIYRDDFGIPHIFAETNRGLFEAYGSFSIVRSFSGGEFRRDAEGTLLLTM